MDRWANVASSERVALSGGGGGSGPACLPPRRLRAGSLAGCVCGRPLGACRPLRGRRGGLQAALKTRPPHQDAGGGVGAAISVAHQPGPAAVAGPRPQPRRPCRGPPSDTRRWAPAQGQRSHGGLLGKQRKRLENNARPEAPMLLGRRRRRPGTTTQRGDQGGSPPAALRHPAAKPLSNSARPLCNSSFSSTTRSPHCRGARVALPAARPTAAGCRTAARCIACMRRQMRTMAHGKHLGCYENARRVAENQPGCSCSGACRRRCGRQALLRPPHSAAAASAQLGRQRCRQPLRLLRRRLLRPAVEGARFGWVGCRPRLPLLLAGAHGC